MKKIFLLILMTILSFSTFAIVDFNGLNWGDSKNAILPLFKDVKEEPSLKPNTEVLVARGNNENISNYKFYFKNNQLYKIRVCFNKETVGTNEIKGIFKKMTKNFGTPVSKAPINKKVSSYTLRGNYLKFIPDLSTDVYYIGVDTVNDLGKMTDSNLYLDYVASNQENIPEI